MKYISTRGAGPVSASEAVLRGLAPDGGLYVPESLPALNSGELEFLKSCSYGDAARLILKKYLEDFSEAEIDDCVSKAYESERFASKDVFELRELEGGLCALELYHGPTAAFKDMALQLTPRLLTKAAAHCGERDRIAVLVATSGDTGKAALEGFCELAGTSVCAVYPAGGVSELQRRQMITQRGSNTRVIALEGNFDDAQNAVKHFFSSESARAALARRGAKPSSANSINWGRLLPQIVYYSLASVRLAIGGAVDFAVPTGNFGNILAAYYAKRMGAPVGRLLCACNRNDVLADFINTGVYDRRREFFRTLSPSMDILVSSNLERLLFELSGHDAAFVSSRMDELSKMGHYSIGETLLKKMRELFSSASCGDGETLETIERLWREQNYLCDTHTAAAFFAARGFESEKLVVVSTASPYKFPVAVLSALEDTAPADDWDALRRLETLTGIEAPKSLRELESLPVLHTERCAPGDLVSVLSETL
ncbi:MAG: threonine synthase [Oscillospiraceae bacterium]|nr:threonine synthase [Oscillospiraceae bacterium]